MIVHPDPEVAATLLSSHPDFRVLRRFQPRERYYYPSQADSPLKVGLYVDAETTGLDVTRDQIIELAILPFEFAPDGRVFAVGAGMAFYNDPGVPIPPEVTALTGIADEMVKGKRIGEELVAEALRDAALVIAHHADFDRKIIERRLPGFAPKPWACSYMEVEWERFGAVGSKLTNVLEGACHEFYDAHRALDDCRVGLHVLAAAQLDGRTALAHLLESAREATVRIWANDAAYHLKDVLKAHGYRWHDGATGHAKAWYLDARASAHDAEIDWLHSNVGLLFPQVTRFTALDRYSERVR